MNKKIINILKSKPHNKHYLQRYIKYISKLKNRILRENTYFETHHICPKANDLFPIYKNESWNLVKLSGREHYIAHWMLSKAYGGSQIYAFWSFCNKQSRNNNRKYNIGAKQYEKIKSKITKQHSIKISGTKNHKNSLHKKNKVHCYDENNNYLIVSKEEFYDKSNLKGISSGKGNSAWTKSDIGRKTISDYMCNRKWMIHTQTGDIKFVKQEETNTLLENGYVFSFKSYDREKYKKECPHCSKLIDPTNYARWHGDKCKAKR